jgi:hypothetical protein
MEKEAIKYGVDTVFHMIRHFENIHSNDLSNMLNAGYTQVQIDNELKIYGSKFHPSFATTLADIIQKVQTNVYIKTLSSNGNYQLYFPNTSNDIPINIGTLAVVPLDYLTQSQKQNIYIRENRGYPLKHVDVAYLPTTSEWTMILKPQTNDSFYFLTAFPGKPALPIPHHEMSLTEKNTCIDFWNEHVFLVNTQY